MLGSRILQLWQRRNWHWYQVLERRWEEALSIIPIWSQTSYTTLHLVTSSGTHECLRLAFAAQVSIHGTVAVIDGHNVLVTPLQHSVVPPPMAMARVQCSAAVNVVAFGETGGCETLAMILSDGNIACISTDEADLWEEKVTGVQRDCDPQCIQSKVPPLQARSPLVLVSIN
jgi:hypothetical protein